MAITGLLDKRVQLSQPARGGLSPAADGPCSFVSRSHSVTSRPSGYLPLGGPAPGLSDRQCQEAPWALQRLLSEPRPLQG